MGFRLLPSNLAPLRLYSQLRGRHATVRFMLARQSPRFWIGAIMLLAIPGLIWFFYGFSSASLFVGMALGAFARDVGQILRFKRFWPMLHSVLDWNAVEQRLASGKEYPDVVV